MGSGKVLNFSVGVAAKGNPGVAGVVSETSGAIGYIGSEYALALNLTSALMQNSAGNFIEANSTTISAAANVDMPADTRIMITNSPEPEAYPISTFTWLILYKEQSYNNRSVNTAKALKELLCYVISEDGQQIAVKTHYAPLSPLAVEKTKAIIESMTYGGNPVVLDEKTDNSNKTE
ncbi:MAG: substrate-binding domain-containing protein [Dysgonomonas sp.]